MYVNLLSGSVIVLAFDFLQKSDHFGPLVTFKMLSDFLCKILDLF